MKALRILIPTIFGFFALLFLAAILIPRFYKDDLLIVIREHANQNLRADLDFTDLHLNLFRQFPLLEVRLDDLILTGQEPFDQVKLFHCESMAVAISLWDLLDRDRPLRIRSFDLDRPHLDIRTLADGKSNLDIFVSPDPSPADHGITFVPDGCYRRIHDPTRRPAFRGPNPPCRSRLERTESRGERAFFNLGF